MPRPWSSPTTSRRGSGGSSRSFGDVCTLLDHDVVVYASGPPGASATDCRPGLSRSSGPARCCCRRRQVAAEADRSGAPVRDHPGGLRRSGAARPAGARAAAGGSAADRRPHPRPRDLVGRAARRPIAAAPDRGRGATTSPSSPTTPSGGSPPRSARGPAPGCSGCPPRWTPTVFRPGRDRRTDGGPDRAVAVGRFVAQKGFDTLLRAWRLVVDRLAGSGPAPELVLVGDGPQRRRLEQLARPLGLTGRVRFTGALPRSGVVAELQRARRVRPAGPDPAGRAEPGGPRTGGARGRGLRAAGGGRPLRRRAGDGAGRPGPASSSPPTTIARWPIGWSQLLTDPARSRAMGAAGRRFVAERFSAAQARHAPGGAAISSARSEPSRATLLAVADQTSAEHRHRRRRRTRSWR